MKQTTKVKACPRKWPSHSRAPFVHASERVSYRKQEQGCICSRSQFQLFDCTRSHSRRVQDGCRQRLGRCDRVEGQCLRMAQRSTRTGTNLTCRLTSDGHNVTGKGSIGKRLTIYWTRPLFFVTIVFDVQQTVSIVSFRCSTKLTRST